ncbi:MAG: DUF3857 domain-containing protein [Bacteroidota bacterium]
MNFRTGLLLFSSIWANLLWGQQQNGWDQLLENDFLGARKSFSQALAQDSSDQQSMLGLLYLADIFRDSKLQDQLSEKLLLSAGQDIYFRAFPSLDLNKSQIEELIQDDRLSESVRLPYQSKLAQVKRLDTYEALCQEMAPFFLTPDWYYIGPFRNIGGSGFAKAYGPEAALTQITNQAYDNGVGKPLRWIQPQKQDPNGLLNPADTYLPANRIGDLYYMHKRFFLEEDQTLYLELGRSLPIKLWLDGELILSDPDGRGLEFDGERFRILLSAGNHDLRIKLSPYNPNIRQYEEFSFFDTAERYGRQTQSEGVIVRLVDAQGKLVRLSPLKAEAKQGALKDFESLEDQNLLYLKSKIKSEDFQWSDYYLLARLFLKKELYQEGISFFTPAVERYSESVYLRSFLAMFHGKVGNFVQASRSLERVDLKATPLYPLVNREMTRLNAEMQSELYYNWLSLLQEIASSNRATVRKSIDFYRLKNWSDTLDIYKDDIVERYPDYENMFRESYSSKGKGEKEKFSLKRWRKAQKLKRERKKRKENPLKGHEETLARFPFYVSSFTGKANYHRAEDEQTEALATISEGLLCHPYSSALLELKGEIYQDMGQLDSALHYFELADAHKKNVFYYRDELSAKIKSLRSPIEARNAFKEVSFEDILAQESEWQARYQQENVVIPLRTMQFLVDTSGNVESTQKMLVQINTVNGVRAWTQSNFSYLGDNVSIKVVRPDGTEFRPEQNGNFAVFKDLRPGDRIYAEGTATDGFSWQEFPFGDHWMLWQPFMLSYPIHFTYLEIGVPQGENLPYVPYRIDQEPAIRTEAGYDFYRWELKDVPKLKEEEAGFADWYSSPSLWFSNETDWSKYVEWYNDLTYRKLDPNPYLQKLYDELVEPGMSDEEKVIAFYTYITKEINYSSVSFLQSNFEPQATELTCTSGIGDCKDVATLMIALLRMADIESYYALTLAGQYIPFECLPQLIFNHVVVAYVIDGKMEYVDLTTDRFPYRALPEMDADAWALLIKEGEDRIFRLPDTRIDPERTKISYHLGADLKADGSIALDINGIYTGVEGARFREILTDTDQQESNELFRRELNIPAISRQKYAEFELENLDKIHDPLYLQTGLQAPEFTEDLYDLTILTLPLIVEGSLPDALLQEERLGLLDVSQITVLAPTEQDLLIRMPEGMKLYQIPEDVRLRSQFGEYSLEFRLEESGLRVIRKNQFTQAIVKPEDYQAFREYYFQRFKHDRTKLVLVKE